MEQEEMEAKIGNNILNVKIGIEDSFQLKKVLQE